MMRFVCVLALHVGVSALQQHKPSYVQIMTDMSMALKTRHGSDVTLDMEEVDNTRHDAQRMLAEDAQKFIDEYVQSGQFLKDHPTAIHADSTGRITAKELGWAKEFFALFVILAAVAVFAVYYFNKNQGAVSIEDVQSDSLGVYNKIAPVLMLIMSFMTYCAVVGNIMHINRGAYTHGVKTDVSGCEGRQCLKDRMENPGERAFFVAMGLCIQACLGTMICLYLRKSQEIKLPVSVMMKMACRGAAVGILATMSVEFIRLPFHNYMTFEDNFVARIFIVLLWVGGVAFMEEAMKIGAVALGLKRNPDDLEALPAWSSLLYIVESPHALAICGLAAGMGFAFVENIPRFYALALQQPRVSIASSWMGNQWDEVIGEGNLRSVRIWTFFFWGLLNVQPWLTGLAAMQLAKLKAPIEPAVWWNSVLKYVVLIHCFFDLLDRSASPFVEFVGCMAIPYAIHTFYKQWKSVEPNGLLGDQE